MLSQYLTQQISSKLSDIFSINVVLQKPKNKKFGHFSSNFCFVLAKELKNSPINIANEYVKKLENIPFIESANSISGFINIFLTTNFLNEASSSYLKNEFSFKSKNHKILLEYVSANPTGPLHIGHARGAIGGDFLMRCGEYLGYDMSSEYYVNDAGKQMDLLGLSVYLEIEKTFKNNDVEFPQEYYRGDYIYDLAKYIFNNRYDISTKDKLLEISSISKDKILEIIKCDLEKIGISFDSFVSEKSLYKDWHTIEEKLKPFSYIKDEKLWLETTKRNDEKDRVIVREDKVPTYLAGDILYHEQKFKRNYDSYINIWGADHHGYIQRVKASIDFLGFDSNKLEIILSQMVALLKDGEPYKMSKRKGNYILMDEVREDIGSDALKFIFLTKKFDTHLEFDITSLKENNSSNPIYYINYANSRVYSLIKKSEFKKEEIEKHKIKFLSPQSSDLIIHSLMIFEVIENSFSQRAPNKVSDYLYELSSLFHSFYNANKFIGEKEEKDYLKISLIVSKSIELGLSMMGIVAKRKM